MILPKDGLKCPERLLFVLLDTPFFAQYRFKRVERRRTAELADF